MYSRSKWNHPSSGFYNTVRKDSDNWQQQCPSIHPNSNLASMAPTRICCEILLLMFFKDIQRLSASCTLQLTMLEIHLE